MNTRLILFTCIAGLTLFSLAVAKMMMIIKVLSLSPVENASREIS